MDQLTAAPGTAPAGYPFLVERALELIEQCNGAVEEDRLIAHVFGNSSTPGLWRTLLRTLLKDQSALTLRPDGCWTTRTAMSSPAFLDEYVVLDVETTGLRPGQQRVIEIGLVRVSAHGAPVAWSTLLNPERRIPKYIASLTGIDDQMVATAPSFRSVAKTVLELVGDLPIVGHNAAFDVAFLNAELGRCGQQKLVNPYLDTLALSSALVHDARRLNLADVARTLGVNAPGAHRALPDAETTLRVFRELLQRAQAGGYGSFEDLLRLSATQRPRHRGQPAQARGRALLDGSLRQSIPHAPGVYIMRDADDRVMYVGKSRDLRKRVDSYYSQPLGYTRKMDGLLESLTKIEVETTGSELEALILESQLIRRYRPRFNTVQRNAEQYVYIKVDIGNPWPRVTATKDRADDGAEYFGPFHSNQRVREAVDLVNDILPLRTCKRSFMDARSYGKPCIELSLNRCLGPCMGHADREVYRGLIHDVRAFFHGDTDGMIAHLHRKLEDAARTLDFERAARLRDHIQRVERLVLEQVRLDDAARHGHALLVLPSSEPECREVWYLLRGQRWASVRVEHGGSAEQLYTRLAPIAERAEAAITTFVANQHAVDEMALLSRWMRKTPQHPAFIPFEPIDGLLDAARQAMNVDLTIPFGEHDKADPASGAALEDFGWDYVPAGG